MKHIVTSLILAICFPSLLVRIGIVPQAHAQTPIGKAAHEPIRIAEQGSFFVGGTTASAPGEFDPKVPITDDRGLSFQIDHLYAQYQIPHHPRRYPLVMIHGAGQTGKTWESTPDGREGFQTIFLRRRFAVYVVDFPRRGRAGFPSFNGRLGTLVDMQVIPDSTTRVSNQQLFIQFRLGPQYLEYFPNTQFAKAGLDQYLRQSIPSVTDDANVVVDALEALLDKIGPAILVPHSQSGRFASLVATRSPNVKAIVDLEGTNHPFPMGEVPDPILRYDGMPFSAGAPIPLADFEKLTKIPIEIVEGDNVPTIPVPNLLLDIQRIRSVFRTQFVEAVNRHGGDASRLKLPDVGLYGNTHFLMSDLNNLDVADLISTFLHEKGLDGRED